MSSGPDAMLQRMLRDADASINTLRERNEALERRVRELESGEADKAQKHELVQLREELRLVRQDNVLLRQLHPGGTTSSVAAVPRDTEIAALKKTIKDLRERIECGRK